MYLGISFQIIRKNVVLQILLFMSKQYQPSKSEPSKETKKVMWRGSFVSENSNLKVALTYLVDVANRVHIHWLSGCLILKSLSTIIQTPFAIRNSPVTITKKPLNILETSIKSLTFWMIFWFLEWKLYNSSYVGIFGDHCW